MTPFEELGPLDYDPEDAIEAQEDMAYIRSIVPAGATIEQLVATYRAVHEDQTYVDMMWAVKPKTVGDAMIGIRTHLRAVRP